MKHLSSLTFLTIFLLQFFASNTINGQAIAGAIPPGTSVIYSPVDLEVTEVDHDTTTYIDLDLDGTDDVKIKLHRGDISVDDAISTGFVALGNKFSFCNIPSQLERIALHGLGDTLCIDSNEWGLDSFYIVGCIGGWLCYQTNTEPIVIDEYIAYKKNATGEVGWLKISMDLYFLDSNAPITFSISEMLVLSLASDVHEQSKSTFFNILPNPTFDGYFSIQHEAEIETIEIFNSTGQTISAFSVTGKQFELTAEPGLYIVRIRDSKGRYASQKILRLQ